MRSTLAVCLNNIQPGRASPGSRQAPQLIEYRTEAFLAKEMK